DYTAIPTSCHQSDKLILAIRFSYLGYSGLDERSVKEERAHDQIRTCLREAAPAKAGNTAGDIFQHLH
ncbi:MAG: hypothetical protein OEZ41_00540, partial [Nitrospirota bacterium]|nr:hypothetical protein [Nitrospirota bacterium]